ncbi:MAG TPA: glycoside hydrolase family 3 C-terminal domain-containing protein, partial [Candidatus Limiplasma sp.]|nr:glycoside hydrolase family 3 C-terminal domain-containing protein [Candidatus Limiplasma sp.]
MQVRQKLKEMTLAEKAALLSGTIFMETNPIPRLGIPALCTADGPHGLRKQLQNADNGSGRSEPATAFPTASLVACGWNPANAEKMGAAIARESRTAHVQVLLGPGVNIKRNPRCGRNFEYYSEDPLLSGTMGAAFTQGVQSRGVGVSVKHFAVNNAENYRFMGDSVVDERALREIYLRSFETVVRKSKPWTIMCAYNRINGVYCSENHKLLTEILREEWGFDGAVMTDWGAARDRAAGTAAGLDLEMPGDTDSCRAAIIDAVNDGTLPIKAVDAAAERMLTLIERCTAAEDGGGFDPDAHSRLAAEIAADCAVLMQNDSTLPLTGTENLLVVGELFAKMRYQGSGSSLITPTKLITPKDAFDTYGIRYTYAAGYRENTEDTDEALLAQALDAADNKDVVLFFGGLTDWMESEGHDRPHIRLPENQLRTIDTLAAAGKRVVVVLFGGSPVELPFAERVSAIINLYLPGQAGGEAARALLYGEVNPSGKLAETWPMRGEDIPFHAEYAQSTREVYRESIFVGYRYYNTAQRKVRFPFGHGLSYTEFAYSQPQITEADGSITVRCKITNTGSRAGAEVVQLYARNAPSVVYRAARELRAFDKVYLQAGETKETVLCFRRSDLAWYHPQQKAWVLENGRYTLEIGASSENIRQTVPYAVEGEAEVACPYDDEVMKAYTDIQSFTVTDQTMEHLLGHGLPAVPPVLPLHIESRFSDFQQTFFGKILYSAVLTNVRKLRAEARKLPPGQERDNRLKGAMFM